MLCDSHTWIQCTDYKTDGSCNGFIRNFHARNVPGGATPDDFYTNKLLGQDPNFLVCKSDTQATATYSAGFPKASVRAGSTLKTMYTPNGHSDQGDVGRTTFARIHWNRGPNGPATQLKFRKDLNESNELSRTNYAANCATTGDVASLPCVNSFTIPRDTPPNTYSFVWYWPYNKNANQRPFGEEYFSCFEIEVLAADATIASSAASTARTSRSTSAASTARSTSKSISSSEAQSTTQEDSTIEKSNTSDDSSKETEKNNLGLGENESSASVITMIGLSLLFLF
jgi:hypothetical protein